MAPINLMNYMNDDESQDNDTYRAAREEISLLSGARASFHMNISLQNGEYAENNILNYRINKESDHFYRLWDKYAQDNSDFTFSDLDYGPYNLILPTCYEVIQVDFVEECRREGIPVEHSIVKAARAGSLRIDFDVIFEALDRVLIAVDMFELARRIARIACRCMKKRLGNRYNLNFKVGCKPVSVGGSVSRSTMSTNDTADSFPAINIARNIPDCPRGQSMCYYFKSTVFLVALLLLLQVLTLVGLMLLLAFT